MLEGVLADMRRGNIRHVLVKDRLGVSVWRTLRSATMRKGGGQGVSKRVGGRGRSRLKTCDTAGFNPALPRRAA